MSVDPAPPDQPAFVDTNIIVYALAGDDLIRSIPAAALLDKLMVPGRFRTSTQVLQELYVTLTRKGAMRGSERIVTAMDWLAKWPVVVTDYPMIRRAVELSTRHQLSFWDSLIVEAAVASRASILYTEDLQHGREIRGLKIVNPFHETAIN